MSRPWFLSRADSNILNILALETRGSFGNIHDLFNFGCVHFVSITIGQRLSGHALLLIFATREYRAARLSKSEERMKFDLFSVQSVSNNSCAAR